jgi:hypothetical protein
MRKRIVKTTLAVAVVAASAIIGYASYTQYQNKQLAYANPLMEENLDALAEPASGAKFAKDYTSGQGLYVTSITASGSIGAGISVGMRISAQAAASLSGKITCSMMDEYQMICQPNMGCYTVCENLSWRPGKQQTRLDKGCK